MHSSGAEGLAMALNIFDKLEAKRKKVQDTPMDTSRFIIYIANSPPYELPVEFVPKYVGLKMDEILQTQGYNLDCLARGQLNEYTTP